MRFLDEFEANYGQFQRKIRINYNRMWRDYYKHKEEQYKNVKTLSRQYNQANKQNISRKVYENENRLEKIDEETAKIERIQLALERNITKIYQQIIHIRDNLLQQLQNDDQQQGLSPRRIRRFHLFTADETLVGQQCAICLQDINVGRRMRRLTCDGQHSFCPGCCETWFANKNTCPLCRHVFV